MFGPRLAEMMLASGSLCFVSVVSNHILVKESSLNFYVNLFNFGFDSSMPKDH